MPFNWPFRYESIDEHLQEDHPSRNPGSFFHVPWLHIGVTRPRDRRLMKVTGVCGLVIGMAVLAVMRSASLSSESKALGQEQFVAVNSADPAAPSVRTDSPSQAADDLAFTAVNFYHVRDGKPGQDYPWLKDIKLIEPYRETTLSVTNPREGFDYRWEVHDGEGKGLVWGAAVGAEASVVLTHLDENVILLEEVGAGGIVARRLEETVMVKYVRREIRSLTDEEREELLDAMYTLWDVRVDDGEGKELYGENYVDIWAINRLHFKSATTDRCDHFHDGVGFLVSHSLITNTFEYSLQLVNPKLTVPYWDFTIEESSLESMNYDPSKPYTRTPLLKPSWFGGFDADDHIVKDGRWAYTKIPSAKAGNPGNLHADVYGKLRSPWNTNDRPYLSRGAGALCQLSMDDSVFWPSCTEHYNLVAGSDSLYDFVWESMGNPHAPIHFWLGGIMDCDESYERISKLVGSDIAGALTFLANGHRKGTYCDGVWSCAGTADTSVKPAELMEEGTCGCLDYDLTQGEDYMLLMSHFDYLEYLIGDFDEDTKREVVRALCETVIEYGEHGQSSSSLDPTFWPTHPTMERLWQFAVLTGNVKDMSWPDSDLTITLPDGTETTLYVSSYYEKCFGHRGSDVFPYGLLDTDVDGFTVKTGVRGQPINGNTLTNREIMEAFDPRANSMNYIYDAFKWEHCAIDGVDFADAWENKADTSSLDRRQFERQRPLGRVYTQFKRDMADRMAAAGSDK